MEGDILMAQNFIVEVRDNTHLIEDIPQIQENVVKLTGLQLENILGQGPPTGVTPKDTGHLAGSWRKTEERNKVVMSTSAKYAEYLNEGTGIYGPRDKPIVPVRKKALKWNGKGGTFIRRSVKGIEGRHFVEEAVKRLDSKMPNVLQQAVDKVG